MNSIKVILVGESTVGKTSIITQYVENRFEEEHLITIVSDKFPKEFKTKNGEIMKVEIWDTAGNEQFRAVNKIFMKSSKIVILVYDITKPNTFESLKFWYEEVVNLNNKEEMIFAVAGNKSDLYEEQNVSADEGKNYAKSIKAIFGEISAMDHECIEQFFDEIFNAYYDTFLKKDKNEKMEKKEKKEKKGEGMINEDTKVNQKKSNDNQNGERFHLDPVKTSKKNDNKWCECFKKWKIF